MVSIEVTLPGGTTNAGRVSRIGETVRRPDRPMAAATRAVLTHLERRGFTGAPRFLGIDAEGREVLSYIPGTAPIAPTPAWALTESALTGVSELLRGYHDAVQSFDASGLNWAHTVPERFRGPIISHNDPNLDNVIFRDRHAVALIDFDLAAPGSRAWDLACAARLWVPLRAPRDIPVGLQESTLSRLRSFVDAYGADPELRRELVAALPECHGWCYSIIRAAVAEGHPKFTEEWWKEGGAALAERTGRWLAQCAPAVRRALGI